MTKIKLRILKKKPKRNDKTEKNGIPVHAVKCSVWGLKHTV